MDWRTSEDDDGNTVNELDAEAIDYLIAGLEELRAMDPGAELTTPAFTVDAAGLPDAAVTTILRRLPDVDTEDGSSPQTGP